ncbi:MAG TPA: hypothetical protein VM493_12900, partial [Vicinamibacterales bacterium]|nr:hypothetical protein [Vicinamibacterales bacterium]
TVIDDGFGARLSSDGTWVAYFQRTAVAQELRVRVKNLSTAEGRTITERAVLPRVSAISQPIDWVDQNMAWSRTGARLYFVAHGSQGHEIRVADLAGQDEPALLLSAPAGASVRDLRMSPSGEALAYLLGSEVYVWDIAAGRPFRVVGEKTGSGTVHLPGWSSDTAIVLIQSTQRAGGYHMDVSKLALDGSRRTVGTVKDGVLPTAKVDHRRGRLFLSRSIDGVQNLFAMSVADGSMRQITANESPGISFSGVQPMGDDALVFARDERKRDIWLVQRGPRQP